MDRRGAKSSFRPVKNKTAASVQITAEQILRDAFDQREALTKPPEWEITDQQELNEYRTKKRRDFEGWILNQRSNVATYTRYAKWEEQQNELVRARSVYERALEVTTREPAVWTMYAEMEMRHKNVNLARNVWERAVGLMPRYAQFWFKYIHMENMLGNYAGVRQLYSRWMEWNPEEEAWKAYLTFEMRNGETQLVRDIFRRYVQVHCAPKSFLKWAKFEESVHDIERARAVYEAAIEVLASDIEKGIDQDDTSATTTTTSSSSKKSKGKHSSSEANRQTVDEQIFSAFAKFEERCQQHERARAIYKFALDHLPKSAARELYKDFVAFEKKHGDRENIEDVILNKRRFQYEDELARAPHNYDLWFDYIKLEEVAGNVVRVREIYERAIGNVPPMTEKRFWSRYIYLWVSYAAYEELEAKDIPKAREVFKACIQLIPHRTFSFSKIWIMFAHFEIRQKDLDAARKILGQAIGMASNAKIFEAYIELEQALLNFDRCRTIFGKWLERSPESGKAYIAFARFECQLEEFERANAIYEIAIESEALDLPELVWKSYIDLEIERERYSEATALYRRLLERTQHVRVWLSFAKFIIDHTKNVDQSRAIYSEAFNSMKGDAERSLDRVAIFDAWRDFEQVHGDTSALEAVLKLTPTRVKKLKPVLTEDGEEVGQEEYFDYTFPDEKTTLPNKSLMEAALRWKQMQSGS
jgi:crooked neck